MYVIEEMSMKALHSI